MLRQGYFKGLTFLLLAFLIWGQFGCTTNRYRQPISKFQVAAAVLAASARKSYSESNRLNRTLEIRKLTREGKFIVQSDLDKVQFFDDKDLQARFDALDRLTEYVDLLVAIANSDAPERISRSATDLSTALGNLTITAGGLGNKGFPNSRFAEKTQAAFGIAGVIVSEVLKAFIQKKIRQGLEAAIKKGEKPINELIEAIRDDLTVINLRYVRNFEAERSTFQLIYNCEANKVVQNAEIKETCETSTIPAVRLSAASPFSQQALNSHRDQLVSHLDALEILAATDPVETLETMKRAHTRIAALAKSKAPADFADALAAIEAFANAAKRLGDAVEKFKTI